MALFVSINKSVDLTRGEEKVLEALKKLYAGTNDEVVIYVQSTISGKRPDFILIDSRKGISILEVKDWSKDYIKEVNKRRITLLDEECDNPNIQVKGYKNILSGGIFTRNFDIDSEEITPVVVYTNLSEKTKEDKGFNGLFSNEVSYVFKEDIKALELDKLFNNNCEGYSKEDLKKIRIALFPEVEIVTGEENGIQQVEIKALDYDQEEFARRIPIGHYMVTGIPGSGKTVILLARAIHLIKENPQWKILILTYNKSLSYKLQSKLDIMAKTFKEDINLKEINIDNIEVRSFHSETYRLTGGMKKPPHIKKDIWYRETVVDLASKHANPIYDAVLIDEYQDFYMSWIELALKLCKEYKDKNEKTIKNFFLAGDRLQSIYNKNEVSWKSIGLDMRGRSRLLKTSYRSAKEHMALGLAFLSENSTLKGEVEKFYKDDSNDDKLATVNNGSVEFIEGNYEFIGDKIVELKNQGYENKDFLILGVSEKKCNEIRDSIKNRIKYQMKFVKDIKLKEISDTIILTTYHSSKGLEAKVVFLTNMDGIFNGEDAGDILKRKTVYVGITRASEKLYILSKPGEKEKLVEELKSLL